MAGGLDPATVLSSELLVLVLRKLEAQLPCHKQRLLVHIARLSRSWGDAVAELVNEGCATDAGISPARLRKLKNGAAIIQMGSMKDEFMKVAQQDLGTFDFDDYTTAYDEEEVGNVGVVIRGMLMAYKAAHGISLDQVADEGATNDMFEAIASSYKKVLVVKAVEALATPKAEGTCWSEKSMVSPLVDALWHVHMMRPKHYLESCTAILGTVDVIDHDPGYVSPKAVKDSDLAHKMQRLYGRERKFSMLGKLTKDGFCDLEEDVEGFMLTRTPAQWLELAFEEEEYGCEMDCG